MDARETVAGEPVRLFVGTDRSQMLATRILESSIRRRTDAQVEVTPLLDVRLPEPADPRNRQRTGFSFARFAIPKLAGHRGRAIYTDADMIVFGDIGELWSLDFAGAKLLVLEDDPVGDETSGQNALWRRKQTAVMVFDCQALDWDAEAIVRGLDEGRYDYDQLVHEICVLDESAVRRAIPPDWNCVDAFDPARTRLYHFTDMPTQPWVKAGHPFGHLWTTELRALIAAGGLTRGEVEEEIALGWVRPSLLTELDEAPDGQSCPPELIDRLDAEDRSKEFVPHAAAIAERQRQKAAEKAAKKAKAKPFGDARKPAAGSSPARPGWLRSLFGGSR